MTTLAKPTIFAAALGLALLSVVASSAPATAASTYRFAYGAGPQARMFQSSQWNPGTCTIGVDYNLAQQYPALNTVDSVVVSLVATGLSGKSNVPFSWGATAQSPTGAKLLVRYVDTRRPGCPHQDVLLTHIGASLVNVPVGYDLMVVTAAEGTVQPWFSV